MAAFEYRHRVGFEDTNLVGNVYYVNPIRWQGRCRELFLRECVPEILDRMKEGLILVTTRASCEYLHELTVFDEVAVRMQLGSTSQSRVSMLFDFVRCRPDGSEELVARGEQQVAFLTRDGASTRPTPVPASLLRALLPYANRQPSIAS